MDAILALEDGTWYRGAAAGAEGEARGEVVFNTSMTGYQEILTDPSYSGQIVTMTCPEIGNYGVSSGDTESRAPQVAGFIIRDESPVASNWRAERTLREYLVDHKIVAISDIDTRALTRHLRSGGVLRGVIATGHALDPKTLVERACAIPSMEGSDLVKDVTADKAFDWPQEDPGEFGIPPHRIAIVAHREHVAHCRGNGLKGLGGFDCARCSSCAGLQQPGYTATSLLACFRNHDVFGQPPCLTYVCCELATNPRRAPTLRCDKTGCIDWQEFQST
jgi:hypothetical protein